MEALSLIGMILGLVLMIIIVLKGYSMLIAAPLGSLVVCIFSWQNVVKVLTGPYMTRFSGFVTGYFFLLILSAIFGKLIGDSGAGKYIAYRLAQLVRKIPGPQKVWGVMAVIVVQMAFTMGGISLFVVTFTVVAIAKNLFEELDIPWNMYSCGSLGSGCLTMTMIPGAPSLNNLIPMKYLGTTATAAPALGTISAVIALALGIIYVVFMTKRNESRGGRFLPAGAEISKLILPEVEVPKTNLFFCLFPSVVLLIILNGFKQNPIVALTAAIVLTIAIYFKKIPDIKKSLAEGAMNGVSVLITVSAVVGFGGVITSMPGYQLILSALDKIPGPPVFQLIVAVNIAAGITGSSSAGLGISLDALSQRFLDMGMNPQVIHRIAAMSSGGLDSLPHSSAVINALTVTRLTYNNAYGNYFVMTVVIPIVCTVIAAILATLGVV
jgi:H+/gluconate symporter-like permease